MGKANARKRDGERVRGEERAVLWGVVMDGQLGNYLFPDMEAARRAALDLREQHPASTLEFAQVGVQLLMRRPFRPKIERFQGVPREMA